MSDNFNKLTPAQDERLALLMEELAEAIHVIGKIMRHGYDSFDPTKKDSPENRQLLLQELGDIDAAKDMMIAAGDLVDGIYQLEPGDCTLAIERAKARKLHAVTKYLHHQRKP